MDDVVTSEKTFDTRDNYCGITHTLYKVPSQLCGKIKVLEGFAYFFLDFTSSCDTELTVPGSYCGRFTSRMLTNTCQDFLSMQIRLPAMF